MSTSVAPSGVVRAGRDRSDIVGFVAFAATAIFTAVRQRDVLFVLAPVLLYELASACSFLIRGRAVRTSTGFPQRGAAYGATFLMPFAMPLLGELAPSWLAPTDVVPALVAGGALRLMGLLLCVWGLWHLRLSFSVEPAARALVTTGPYALFRHPLYVGYATTYLGALLQRPTVPYAAIVALWFWLTALRARYEEAVLAAAFPEYAAYRARVGLLGPRRITVR